MQAAEIFIAHAALSPGPYTYDNTPLAEEWAEQPFLKKHPESRKGNLILVMFVRNIYSSSSRRTFGLRRLAWRAWPESIQSVPTAI